MYLRYYLDQNGNRVYTLKVVLEDGSYTLNAHPARFSPDDKFSKERMELKERFGLLVTQVEEVKYWSSPPYSYSNTHPITTSAGKPSLTMDLSSIALV